ncbi:VanZ family protein [Amycolatopsis sp. NPDC051106]|uniref:VanZ family protein n=1 Tax=unclassified Amycolatopsis TaxID=2618356 RepID=UPI0034482BB6
MDVLLRAFWGMIPVWFIALPYALIAWPLVAARRRRRLPARYATATAGVDSAACLVAFLVLCLVTMPVGTSGESTLDLVPGADITAAFGDGSLWQVIGNVLLLCPLGALPPGRVTSTDDVLLNTAGATLGAALSRRGWRALDPPPVPVAIPVQRRAICHAPTLRMRVPRLAWDTRYASIAHPDRR